MQKKNHTSKPEARLELEQNLPPYLQHDPDAYKECLENDSELMDCLWGELYGSINVAQIDDRAITREHADYPRNKYLYNEEREEMEKEQKIQKFNEKEGRPFYIADLVNGEYSLCLLMNLTPEDDMEHARNAFMKYAREKKNPAEQHRGYDDGTGYEWEQVFKAAFQGEETLSSLTFDSESSGFFCSATDLDALIDYGKRFVNLCRDKEKIRQLVEDTLAEYYREKDFHEINHTVKWCLEQEFRDRVEIHAGGYVFVIHSLNEGMLHGGQIFEVQEQGSGRTLIIDGRALLNYRVTGMEAGRTESEKIFHAEFVSGDRCAVWPRLVGHSPDGVKEGLSFMEDVARYIFRHAGDEQILLTCSDGSVFMRAGGGFIKRASDMEYFKNILNILVPMRLEESMQERKEGEHVMEMNL